MVLSQTDAEIKVNIGIKPLQDKGDCHKGKHLKKPQCKDSYKGASAVFHKGEGVSHRKGGTLIGQTCQQKKYRREGKLYAQPHYSRNNCHNSGMDCKEHTKAFRAVNSLSDKVKGDFTENKNGSGAYKGYCL